MNLAENNKVLIIGEVLAPFQFSSRVFDEDFYQTYVSVSRLSGEKDIIPVLVSNRMFDVTQDLTGKTVFANGQYRSYIRKEGERNHLILTMCPYAFMLLDDKEVVNKGGNNQIMLDGYICRKPVFRKTPKGREITDLFVAVNHPYGKSDYIPCICWGENARYAEKQSIGTNVIIHGRIQSREYSKRINETEVDVRVAYEVSVSKIKCK